MQAAWQKYFDNSVSKTVNLPSDAAVEDVDKVYKLAWELGCKGITVYRDGSREGQVLTDSIKDKGNNTKGSGVLLDRPSKLPGYVFKVKVNLDGNLQNAYISVTLQDDKPYEVFVYSNIMELDPNAATALDTITRLISLALRSGATTKRVIEQLEKVSGATIYSLPLKIASILKEFLPPEETQKALCPECGYELSFKEGCISCDNCGWSKCS